MRVRVGRLAKVHLRIVRDDLLGPILGGLAPLFAQNLQVSGAPWVERGESAQHGDKWVAEMRVCGEILHCCLFSSMGVAV